MYTKTVFLLLLLCPCILLAQQPVNIIPRPVSLQLQDGYFTIDGTTSLVFDTRQKELQAMADLFKTYIRDISGYTLPVNGNYPPANKPAGRSIRFIIDRNTGAGAEGYRLHVSPSAITITAVSKAGVFYGIQSLLQTLPQIRTNAALRVPCMDVLDYPRFAWRGMMLDVSRHFFSPDMIREYIDLMAMYKMNVFHWHLCDDQGWRLEIKKYPLLTQVGAWRVDRPGRTWGDIEQAHPGEVADYGGFYTQQQVREIVAYAQQRNITIVPEIEMPGHSSAALTAYPQLSCSRQPQLLLNGCPYPKGIQTNYCVGNDSSFVFLQDVLQEVMQLFPSEYIHIGGDEVDKSDWKKCPRCQAREKAEGLKDEEELQSYFIRRIEKYLIAHNRKLIGWDEILEGGLAPEATVMSWRGESGGIQAAKMKHEVVMTPGTPCYFDHYQAGPEGEPVAIGGFNTLRTVYDYEPIPAELTKEEGKYVLGAQGNVWTEFIPTRAHLEYMILPRMAALSEVLWTPAVNKDFAAFNQRLQYHFAAYDQKGLNYCPGNFTVDIKPVSKDGKLSVNLSTETLNGDIYYTVDGSTPTNQSAKYTQPFVIDSSVMIKAVTIVNGTVRGTKPATQPFVMHKAVGRDVTYANPVSKYYLADGPNSLTDGIRGTTAAGKYWHGFEGDDLIATIDLADARSIHSLSIGCLQNYGDWIFLPQWVKFEVSADGQHFEELQTVSNTISVNEKNATIKDFTTTFPGRNARFIRITAKNLGVCPKGHSGEGQPAWLFADEIVVQ